MKKPRGKQPTKPDVKKALISRSMELKGTHKATFTIPVIYRRTFNWDSPEVNFVPLNHRCFLVYRGDLDTEEYRREMYTKLKLDINDLPTYAKNRLKSQDTIEVIELKEAILAASLKNRYVEITIPKPREQGLYKILKQDMEELADELGFEYSADSSGIKCTFKFPKHDIKYYAMESKICVQNALAEIKYFCNQVEKNKFEGALKVQEELLYNIERLEILMDRYYSDALNIIWDVPSISCPGYFL